MRVQSGTHLAAVRSWMQTRFRNGSQVTWGSQDHLSDTSLTVSEMELLAQNIREAVIREFCDSYSVRERFVKVLTSESLYSLSKDMKRELFSKIDEALTDIRSILRKG